MLGKIWKKAQAATFGGVIGGAIGVVIAIQTVPEDVGLLQQGRYIAQLGTVGGAIGFAIDGVIGITRRVRSRDFQNYYEELKNRLQDGSGGLDPENFLLKYIQLNYYTDSLNVTNSDKIEKNLKQIGDELCWIVNNVFPRIRSEITRENLRNADFLIELLHELDDAFLEVNQGHDNWWLKLQRSREKREILIQKIIQRWREKKDLRNFLQNSKALSPSQQPSIDLPVNNLENIPEKVNENQED